MSRTHLPAFALLSWAMCALMWIWNSSTFVVGNGTPSRNALRTSTARKAWETPYPNLERVEDMISDSCHRKDGKMHNECVKALNRLMKLHQESAEECDIDQPIKCMMLNILEKATEGVNSKEGMISIHSIVQSVQGIRGRFENWDAAFASADTDKNGEISLSALYKAFEHTGSKLTDTEIALVHDVVDTDCDGTISKEEFRVLISAVEQTEETILKVLPDRLPRKQPSFEEYMELTMGSRPSWGPRFVGSSPRALFR